MKRIAYRIVSSYFEKGKEKSGALEDETRPVITGITFLEWAGHFSTFTLREKKFFFFFRRGGRVVRRLSVCAYYTTTTSTTTHYIWAIYILYTTHTLVFNLLF